MIRKLLLLSFIEGAAVMAAELCGAKLMAPIFGSSLFVWASVMGFTLAGLAAGYFCGGYLTQKTSNSSKLLFQLLNLASLTLILMPVISYYLLPRLSYLPFLSGVVLSTFLLLFPSVFFLGATSPVFITTQTINKGDEGKASGTVYAVSTTGGILATFLCGFYLIPQIGLNKSLLAFGVVLFIANLVVFKFYKISNFFLLAIVLYLNLQFINKASNTIYKQEGLYGTLTVEDLSFGSSNKVRLLKTNSISQTEMNLITGASISRYMNILDTLIPDASGNKKALLLGVGGGLLANILVKKKYKTDGIELDERIIEVAKKYFFLSKDVNVFNQDARYFINKTKNKYDVLVVDVFKGEEPPSHVLTIESLKQIHHFLSHDGIMYINWHGYLSNEIGLGTGVLYNTLVQAGFYVKLCSSSYNEAYRNLIFVASKRHLPPQYLELNHTPTDISLVNTDSQPLLEKYNAMANKAWRVNYLRYYQGLNN